MTFDNTNPGIHTVLSLNFTHTTTGPVFNQETNEVVGVAFCGRNDAEGVGYIIPTPVVRNFIAVFEATGTFGRLPAMGIHAEKLENDTL